MRPLSATCERRTRRPDCSARLLVEIDKIVNARIVDTPADWVGADSLTGISVRPDGSVRLSGTTTTLIDSTGLATDGTHATESTMKRLGSSSVFAALVSINPARNPNLLLDQVVAKLHPDPAATGRIVDQWACQCFGLFVQLDQGDPGGAPGGDVIEAIPISNPVYVVESGTAEHNVTFNFPNPIAWALRPIQGKNTYPNITILVLIWAIKNDGTAATNVRWSCNNSSSYSSGSSTIYAVRLDKRTDGRYLTVTGAGINTPLVKLSYLTFVSDDVTFTTNPLDAGADPSSNSLVRLVGRARVPPGTVVRFYVRNDADTAWVQYTDGQRATDLVGVDFTATAGTARKFRVELDTNGTADVTPEVTAIGFEYVTTTPFHETADVESVEWIVDPVTLKGRIAEIRVRGIADGVHDFNSAIEELVSENDIADLAIQLYWGHPEDDRKDWTHLDSFPVIDDIENEGGSHVLIGLSALALLRGPSGGERRLPRFDVVTNQREELVYSASAALNAPSEIWDDLLKVQLNIAARHVGQPPENVTLTYLDEAGASQTIDLATQTAMKKRIADSLAHDEVDALSFVAGCATTTSQGKIVALPMRGSQGPVRAVFTADEITWGAVTPGFRLRQPVLFLQYNFWDNPDDPDEVRAFHQASIDNLGGGRVSGADSLPEIVGSWITSKALAEAVTAREIARFGTGLLQWSFETMYSWPELEIGDRVVVEVDRFAAKDPNVGRFLRGALWAIGRIVGVHDARHTRFSFWIEDWADIVGSTRVVTRLNLDELTRARVYKSGDQTFNAADGVITFDSEDHDKGGYHDTVTNNDRLTVPAGYGGVYSVIAHIKYSAYTAAGFDMQIRLRKNNATPLVYFTLGTSLPAAGDFTMAVPHVELLPGDFVNLFVDWDSGGAITIKGTDSGTTFDIRRAAPIRPVAGTPQAIATGIRR